MAPKRTDPPVYFIDRSLGSHDVADALRGAGALVEVHDDHFDPATTDEVWLRAVGARGWIVLTKDARIRRHPLELEALMASGVGAFILTATGVTGADMGRILVAALPSMERIIRTRVRPFIATITGSGYLEIRHGGARRGGVKR